jgi:uncharacterized protein YcbK (DUF882 family)
MLRVALAVGLFLLPASAFSRDYCEGNFCFQKKARVNCLKPGVWDMLNKIVARIGRVEITSACDGKHVRHSYHYRGQAVDFRPMQTTPRVAVGVLRSMPDVGGIGTYSNGLLHADIRPYRMAWHHFRKARARYAKGRSHGPRRMIARATRVAAIR